MNFAKYQARPWQSVLAKADKEAVDLVKSLVVFQSTQRLGAEEVSTSNRTGSDSEQAS